MSNKEKPIILIGKPAQKRFAKVLSQHNFEPLYLPADTRLALPKVTERGRHRQSPILRTFSVGKTNIKAILG